MYVCMCVGMHVCMHVFMYACMYVFVRMYPVPGARNNSVVTWTKTAGT